MNRTAECCCGKNEITISGDPMMHGICSCDNCKKRTGSAFGISAYYCTDQIVGDLPTSVCEYKFQHNEMNHEQKRYFCNSCGTTLFWYISSFKNTIGIAGGCFIREPLPTPLQHANYKQKCAWLTLDEACEEVEPVNA